MAIGAADFFRETWNWMSQWCANMKAGDGLAWEARDSGHPVLKCNLVEGDGIRITRSNGALKISLSSEDDGTGDDQGGSQSGGGSGSSGGNNAGGSAGNGGGAGDGNQPGSQGQQDQGGGSGSGGGGNQGTSCNDFSDDLENSADDLGMDNGGDNCAELNGW